MLKLSIMRLNQAYTANLILAYACLLKYSAIKEGKAV